MKIEIRSDKELRISGYVNAVERRSNLLSKEKGEGAPGDFTEMIKAGAFADSLQRIPKVEMKFNHGKVIGSTGSNLELIEDSIGLHAEATIIDEETVKAARAGQLRGWSFGMKNAHGEYIRNGAVYERDIDSLDLLEVSLLTRRPAYPATSVELRDGESVEVRESGDPEEVSPEDMSEINSYTRRDLSPDEVYVFPVTLCDNQIDRDGERFTAGALSKLAELFVGKTGIFDHIPSGQNQTARIYETNVVVDASKPSTADGEPYTALTAKAYMMRTSSNADLIKEIDAGIKKEVSISCAVKMRYCSICGEDAYHGCEHQKGRSYEGKVCCHVLDEPLDAYEWSFVAVPAQPKAMVTRAEGSDEGSPDNHEAELEIKKLETEILKLT